MASKKNRGRSDSLGLNGLNGHSRISTQDLIPDTKVRLGPGLYIMLIHVLNLKIDRNYQRVYNPRRVRAIIKNYNPKAFGIIDVSQRGRQNFITDGQHRYLAVLDMYRTGTHDGYVACLVRTGLTDKEEAKNFTDSNSSLPIRGNDLFKSRLFYGAPVETDINRIVEKHALYLAFPAPGNHMHPSDGRGLFGQSWLLQAYQKCGNRIFEEAVRLVKVTFTKDGNSMVQDRALHGEFINGIAHYLKEKTEGLGENVLLAVTNETIGRLRGANAQTIWDEAVRLAGPNGRRRVPQLANIIALYCKTKTTTA